MTDFPKHRINLQIEKKINDKNIILNEMKSIILRYCLLCDKYYDLMYFTKSKKNIKHKIQFVCKKG